MGARLVDDVLGTLFLDRAHGFSGVSIDPGYPVAREVTQPRINANGTIDDTVFFGARAVSVSALVLPVAGVPRRVSLARLRAFCAPDRRPVLVFDEDGDGAEIQMRLRGSNVGAPLEGYGRRVQATWVAPDGVLEAVATTSVDVSAVPADVGGLGAPLGMPSGMPGLTSYNTVTVTNAGTAATPPLLALWGPCTGPRLTNVTTGRTFWLPGVSLTADQFALVDVQAATILLNGRPTESLYTQQQWGVSSFWWLRPGVNLLRYEPASYLEGAHATVTYRERSI